MYFINVTRLDGTTVASFHETSKKIAEAMFNHLKNASDLSEYIVTMEKGM